jgi:hypothetical protein
MHLFPIETTIRNASIGEKRDRNHTTPVVSEIHTKQSNNEENSSLFMKTHFVGRQKRNL